MKGALLDVNVLVALFWPAHNDHEKTLNWFKHYSSRGWATCPLTQSSFVRIVSNPMFSRSAVTVEEATKLLAENLEHPSHVFWPAEARYPDLIESFVGRIVGHQQVTDSYLLGMAIHNRGTLVTMDRGILSLLPDKLRERGIVELIQ
jgi:uncharacterized protein